MILIKSDKPSGKQVGHPGISLEFSGKADKIDNLFGFKDKKSYICTHLNTKNI